MKFLFFIFMFFLFNNHLCEDSFYSVFYRLFMAIVVRLKLSSCSCLDRLSVLTTIFFVSYHWLVYDAFHNTLIFNAQKCFVTKVFDLILNLISTPRHEQVLLLLNNWSKGFIYLISAFLNHRVANFFIVWLEWLLFFILLLFSGRKHLCYLNFSQINLQLLLKRPSSISTAISLLRRSRMTVLFHWLNELLVFITDVLILLTKFLVLLPHHIYQIYLFFLQLVIPGL